MQTIKSIKINSPKDINEPLNIKHTFPLPANTPFGNLYRKGIWIIERKDYLNLKINEINAIFPFVVMSNGMIDSNNKIKLEIYIEEFVASIRRLVDELIGLYCYLSDSIIVGYYLDNVSISEVGVLFKSGNENHELYKFLQSNNQLDYLEKLNFISNIFKHSFSLTDVDTMRVDKPGRTLIHFKNNKLSSGLRIESFDVDELTNGYNQFDSLIIPNLEILSANAIQKLK